MDRLQSHLLMDKITEAMVLAMDKVNQVVCLCGIIVLEKYTVCEIMPVIKSTG